MSTSEQLGTGGLFTTGNRKGRKFAKKQTRRADRRAAKRDPEGAPTRRRYRGWWW